MGAIHLEYNDIDLFQRLKKGPSILFLGQNYLKLDLGYDPLLKDIMDKYADGNKLSNYSDILDSNISKSIETSLAWIQNKCEHLTVPNWLHTVASFSWNSIYTSAIDNFLTRVFQSEWREFHPILTNKYNPEDSRNKLRLHATYLFGCINRCEDTERPPMTKIELTLKKPIMTSLAGRLPDLITPFGTICIEGYDGETDWFSFSDLFPVLDKLNVGQAHFFKV